MNKKKKYKVTGKNVEYLQSYRVEANSTGEAKDLFICAWNAGDIPIIASQIEFQEIKKERR